MTLQQPVREDKVLTSARNGKDDLLVEYELFSQNHHIGGFCILGGEMSKSFRSLHITVHFKTELSTTAWMWLAAGRNSTSLENCIICQVAESISDEEVLSKVREYLENHHDPKMSKGGFELELGHNKRKLAPHLEREARLMVTVEGCNLK